MSKPKTAKPITTHSTGKDTVILLHPSDIVADSDKNNRKDGVGTKKEIDALADSIREHGQLQPVLVTLGADGRYHMVAGFGRHAAGASIAETDPTFRLQCRVIALDDEEHRFKLNLIENVQRRNLSPIDVARAQERLRVEFGWKGTEIAAFFGISSASVSNHKRLLTLPEEVQRKVHTGVIGVAAALELSREEPEKAKEIAEKVTGKDKPDDDAEGKRAGATRTGASKKIREAIEEANADDSDDGTDPEESVSETPALKSRSIGEVRKLALNIQELGDDDTESPAYIVGKALLDFIDGRAGLKDAEEEIGDLLAKLAFA